MHTRVRGVLVGRSCRSLLWSWSAQLKLNREYGLLYPSFLTALIVDHLYASQGKVQLTPWIVVIPHYACAYHMPHYEVILEFNVFFWPHILLKNPVTLDITPYSVTNCPISKKREERGERKRTTDPTATRTPSLYKPYPRPQKQHTSQKASVKVAKKTGSFSLIERVILSAGAMLIFSVSFQIDQMPEGTSYFFTLNYIGRTGRNGGFWLVGSARGGKGLGGTSNRPR